MKVRVTVTVDLEIEKQNEPLVSAMYGESFIKENVEKSILKKVKENFVYENLDLKHAVGIELVD